MTAFPHRLRTLRESKGLSRAQLAALVDCTEQMIGRYELGGAKPGMQMLERLAAALGVTIDALVRGVPAHG